MNRPVVVCGLGRVGWRVLAFLRGAGMPVAVVDLRADPADPRLAGVRVVVGDCRRPEVLREVGVADARGVLIVTGDDLVNLSTALAARRLNPDARFVVRMFNPDLVSRLGPAVRNLTGLSVSALTAPLLALTALTGDALGAFPLDAGSQQVAEITVAAGSPLAGARLADAAGRYQLLILAHLPADGPPVLFHAARGDARPAPGDRVVVCGSPDKLAPLLGGGDDLLPGVRWAGRVRRLLRVVGRTLGAVDLPVQLGGAALFLTLFGSTLVFRYAIGTEWADGLFRTVRVVATGSDLPGADQPGWVKVFVSGLKLAGAALVAAFTAILTQYLIRAKLGGALEARRIPDGGHVVVCGLGNIGFRCVLELVRLGRPVVAVERVTDSPFAATVRRMGVPVVVGDATVREVLRQARADAGAVIAATESELANLEIALLVREMNPAARVVVRLTDPDFADALREAAGIKLAVSAPAVAAPAFAAALFGDRVHTLLPVGGRTLAVVELTVQEGDAGLYDRPLAAGMVDYGFLPVGVAGQEPFAAAGIPRAYRPRAGDRLTVVVDLPDLERLLRREVAPKAWAVEVAAHLATGTGGLVPVVRAARGCSQEEAERLLREPRFVVAGGLTRGEAEELLVRVTRERATARVVPAGGVG